jgi:hypothetical protein
VNFGVSPWSGLFARLMTRIDDATRRRIQRQLDIEETGLSHG